MTISWSGRIGSSSAISILSMGVPVSRSFSWVSAIALITVARSSGSGLSPRATFRHSSAPILLSCGDIYAYLLWRLLGNLRKPYLQEAFVVDRLRVFGVDPGG